MTTSTMSPEGLSVFVEAFWKSGAALGLALCINWLLRNKSADLRRLVLSTAIVAMFVAALASPALPRWTAFTPAWLQFGNSAPVALDPPPVTIAVSETGRVVSILPAAPAESQSRINAAAWIRDRLPGTIPLIWLAGTALLLVRFAIGLRGLRRLRRASEAVTDPDVLAFPAMATASGALTLLQNETITAPVTWGIFRSVILVPAHFEQLPAESRDAVLRHEMAHIQGHDFFMRVLLEIGSAVLWFQPLIWIVSRHLREEQELACDNRVLEAGGKPSAYARLLLDWDARPGADSLIAVGIAHRSCLKRRLHALLSQGVRREPVAVTGVLATWILGLAAALPLAAISLTSADPARPVVAPRQVYSEPAPVAAPTEIAATPQPRLQLARTTSTPVQAPAPQLAGTESGSVPLPRFSTNVKLVQVDAIVKDANGRTMEGLKATDFAITEDGIPQVVSVFNFQKLDNAPQTADAVKDISSYYILGYYSTNHQVDGNYHRTAVALKNDATAKLDFRAGYYANKSFLAINENGQLFMVDGVTCSNCDNSVGPGTTFPVLISQVQPEYAEQARKAKYSGNLTLNIEVDASGNVTSARVVKSLGMGLDDKAMEAVKQWKFKPGLKDGQAAAVHALVDVNFSLM